MGNKFSFSSWSKKQEPTKWRVSHSLSCEENDTANQEPLIMFFTCRLYQGVSRLTVTCSDSLFTPFGKLWKSSLRALYQVELLTKDDWGKICHLSNFCGGFFAIESIQKHKRENKPRIETVHVQIIFATKRARKSSSMGIFRRSVRQKVREDHESSSF